MKIMIISEDSKIINNFNQVIGEYAHLYTINESPSVNAFLERKDINKFDLIFIVSKDKVHAIERIKAKLPKANLILINGEDKVSDHADILRTVSLPLTEKEIRAVLNESEFILKNNPSENMIISCFKSLTFKNNAHSKVPIEIKWRTMKAEELFAYLLLNSNEFQSKKVIQEEFWNDLREKSSTQQLYSSIYEIRKTIEKYKIPVEIINSADKYMLKNENAWVDYHVFEEHLKQINEVTERNYERVKRILAFYTGHLFEAEEYEWAFYKREKLRFLWLIYMKKLCDFYVDKGNVNEAIILNLRMNKHLPNNKMVKNSLNELYALIGEPGF